MDKLELTSYLCNLHTLLEAQTKSVHSIPSTVLADEYEKHWGLLKEAIIKEKEDESDKDRTDHPRVQPRRG